MLHLRSSSSAILIVGGLALLGAAPPAQAAAITLTDSYTVTDQYPTTGPTISPLLSINPLTLPTTLGQPTAPANFFTLSPTQSNNLSYDGATSYHNCITGTGCSGTTETTNVTVHFGNITVNNLTGGPQTVSVGDLTGVFTAQYDPKLPALACSIGDSGPNPGQSDCLIWNGETGPLAGKYNGSVEYTYAIGSTNYQLDVFLYNATDWSITPKVAFEVQDAPAVSAPGNTLGLLGIGLIGTVAMGWRRRRQTVTFAP
jgi:hypothetical protein